MAIDEIRIIESAVVVLLFLAFRFFLVKLFTKAGQRLDYQKERIVMINRIAKFVLVITGVSILLVIWGVEASQLALYITSILTVLGIAFVAQWSILSNITSSLIIFFNHPIKIGEHIEILDTEYKIQGIIKDIGVFFITLETEDKAKVTVPSNVFMLKMIKKKG